MSNRDDDIKRLCHEAAMSKLVELVGYEQSRFFRIDMEFATPTLCINGEVTFVGADERDGERDQHMKRALAASEDRSQREMSNAKVETMLKEERRSRK